MHTQSESKHIHPEETSLKEIFLTVNEWIIYLKRKWVLFLILAILGAAAGYAYASMKKTIYVAEITFTVEDDKGGSGGGLSSALGLASSLGIDLGTSAGNAFSGPNLIQLMKSRRLVEQTLLTTVPLQNSKITLAEMYLRFNGIRESWQSSNPDLDKNVQFPVSADRSKFSLQQDSVLGVMYHAILNTCLQVSQKDKKLAIITVEVRTKNELFSKFFGEALVKEVSDFYAETKSKKAKMNVNILERQADSIRAELNSAITGVAIANDNAFNVNTALNIKRTPSLKKQVDVQANTAILTQLTVNLEMARVTLRKETPLTQLIDTPILPLKKERPSKLNLMITGGFIAAFILLIFLVVRRFIKEI